jgi:hypothetical protein
LAEIVRSRSVQDENGCWIWSGSLANGYGDFRLRKVHWTAHRAAYTAFKGSIGSLHVLHTCDEPACCNPDHLFLGTNAENIRDSQEKGRRKGVTRKRPAGLKYSYASGKRAGPKEKLKQYLADVERLAHEGYSSRAIAKMLPVKVSPVTVWRAMRGAA